VAIRNAAWLARVLDKAFRTDKTGRPRKNYRNGDYRVGYWTLTMHNGFGRLTGAMPNGRKKGESFASGMTPVAGVTPWVVETCNAIAKLPSNCISNGMAFNVKLNPEGKPMLARLMTLVYPFFVKGGMEIQFNIISQHDFIRAKDHPEEYPELLVRVSGYTAYFKDLGREMQEEIISRTEFLLLPASKQWFAKAFRLPKIP
jgi:formate C-acetyltransferase